jgi:CysZ protein
MIAALLRAISEVFLPPLRRVIACSLAIALACFAGLWLLVALLLSHVRLFAWRPLDWLADQAGAFGVLLLTWLLFPAVLTLIIGFFFDRIAGALESLHYPGRGPPRRQNLKEIITGSLRLMGLAIVLNLLALPLYLLLPGINLFIFLAINGYLLGREYFEAVALRRLDREAAKAMRNRFGFRVFIGGIVIAGLFTVPFVNLVAPVIAIAFMLHVFEGLPRTELQTFGS